MQDSTTQTDSRQRLFHRFVGGLVLAALAVLLVPLLAELDPEQEAAITGTNIPPRPEGMRVEEIPLDAPAPVPGHTAPAPDTSRTPVTERAADAAGAAGPEPADPDVPAVTWIVRVGSFSSEQNAIALRDRLRAGGFTAFVDSVTVDGRGMSRVQVGPVRQREQGEELRDRLAREMNLEGLVAAYE